jgi:hypothetical protein
MAPAAVQPAHHDSDLASCSASLSARICMGGNATPEQLAGLLPTCAAKCNLAHLIQQIQRNIMQWHSADNFHKGRMLYGHSCSRSAHALGAPGPCLMGAAADWSLCWPPALTSMRSTAALGCWSPQPSPHDLLLWCMLPGRTRPSGLPQANTWMDPAGAHSTHVLTSDVVAQSQAWKSVLARLKSSVCGGGAGWIRQPGRSHRQPVIRIDRVLSSWYFLGCCCFQGGRICQGCLESTL